MNHFTDFPRVRPEEEGISSSSVKHFLDRLDSQNIAMHSAIIMRHGRILSETYYEPYQRNTLHRMFSITKSFVSLAIGLLEEEGKLSLDDTIVSHFPEKIPAGGVHPYMEQLTIRDMLRMATCHEKTTYKTLKKADWISTFFEVAPTHVPGTCFSYDTSSTHTLSGLVEKLTGMKLLDYLRVKFLNELDFSKDAYCLTDPVGVSMGGSGLMATPYDLLKVMYVISRNGNYNGKQLLPQRYLKLATSKQIDNYGKGPTLEEMQGYGYQFWCTRNNGFVCYGMGGQLALYVPDKDIILITTAFTCERQGGVQLIYDAFWDEIYNKIQDSDALVSDSHAKDLGSHLAAPNTATPNSNCSESASAYTLQNSVLYRPLLSVPELCQDTCADTVYGKTFTLDENEAGWKNVQLCADSLHYENATGIHTLHFKTGGNSIQNMPGYPYRAAASGAWRAKDTFLIRIHIIDECVGTLYMQLVFKNDTVTLMLRKFEETMFSEFNGFISGHC